MPTDRIAEVRCRLPDRLKFNYFADRQSPWLLARLMPDEARVAELRRAGHGKLMDRAALKPLVARSGGLLRRRDVSALAHADRFEGLDEAGRAALAALEAVWAMDWSEFLVTFTDWGTDGDWRHAQITREGGSLVVQLGFPSDHAQLMGRYLGNDARAKFEESFHPVRLSGRPTLAWSRVDVDLTTGEALIEEVQSDWLRLVAAEVEWLAEADARSRDSRAHQAYQRALFARYARIWPQATLLATLVVLRDHLGLRRVWMHRPETGAVLKGIEDVLPPRSLYTALPRSFCFAAVPELPEFLRPRLWRRFPRAARTRLRPVISAARTGRPVFWRLDLN